MGKWGDVDLEDEKEWLGDDYESVRDALDDQFDADYERFWGMDKDDDD